MQIGAPELYAVPKHSGVTSVTLKLWGAGGGGVLTPVAGADVYDGGNGTSNATQGATICIISTIHAPVQDYLRMTLPRYETGLKVDMPDNVGPCIPCVSCGAIPNPVHSAMV